MPDHLVRADSCAAVQAVLRDSPHAAIAQLDRASVYGDGRQSPGGHRSRYSHPHKLTTDSVVRIRELRAAGRPAVDIAADFGVSQSLVCQIATGRLWREAPGPITRVHRDWLQPIADQFWALVDRRGPNECWPWLRRCDPNGYGVFDVGGRSVVASRVALGLKIGRDVEADKLACHSCDNPPCCNPDHLFEGSHADNSADCVSKGRTDRKLSDAEIDAIVSAAGSMGWGKRAKLGRLFGVSGQHVGRVLAGKARQAAASQLLAGRGEGGTT